MLLWTQAVPASSESPLSSDRLRNVDLKSLPPARINRTFHHYNESGCSALNNKLCKYIEDKIIQKRMKHRSNGRGYSNDNRNNSNEPTVKSSKNLHERQVRSFEQNNKITKSNDKNTFTYENNKTSFDFIRNISLDDKIMNNGESVSMENVSEPTLATFKESDVKTNAQKEASDKIYLHVNGEFETMFL